MAIQPVKNEELNKNSKQNKEFEKKQYLERLNYFVQINEQKIDQTIAENQSKGYKPPYEIVLIEKTGEVELLNTRYVYKIEEVYDILKKRYFSAGWVVRPLCFTQWGNDDDGYQWEYKFIIETPKIHKERIERTEEEKTKLRLIYEEIRKKEELEKIEMQIEEENSNYAHNIYEGMITGAFLGALFGFILGFVSCSRKGAYGISNWDFITYPLIGCFPGIIVGMIIGSRHSKKKRMEGVWSDWSK